MTQGHTCTLETYGLQQGNDLCASDLSFTNEKGKLGMKFAVSGLLDFEAQVALPGRFSVYNAMTAIAICRPLTT